MADVILETRTIDQLPIGAGLGPDTLVPVQDPGGMAKAVPLHQLLGHLIKTDTLKLTLAALSADLAHDEHSVALVYADPLAANNGWHRKIGASGVGSWLQFEKLAGQAAAELQQVVDQASALAEDWAVGTAPGGEGTLSSLEAALASAYYWQRTKFGVPFATLSELNAVPAAIAEEIAIGGFTNVAANRAELKAFGAVAGKLAMLTEVGREGWFVCKAGAAPADPLEGIYVASDAAGYYWERQWDGVTARPEWFGAVANSNSGGIPAANLAAINACIVLCPVTRFTSADYWVSGKVLSQMPYRQMIGHFGDGYNTGTGTRIISTNLTDAVVRFGPNSAPVSLAAMMRGIVAKDLTFRHSAALTAPGPASEATAVATIERQYLYKPQFERIFAWEPLIGFRSKGLVQPKTLRCKVLRTEAAAGGSDFCWAAYYDGGIIFAGVPGNPSAFDEEFAGEFNPALNIDKVGLVATGDFSDLFIDRLETSGATSMVRLLGSGTKAQIDVFIRDCVADQCSGSAVDLQGFAAGGCVTISGGYYQSKAGALAVLHLRGVNGTVNITGGCQIVCAEAGSTIGVYAQNQQVVNIDESVTILECPRPVDISGATSGKILCTIQNDTIGDATQGAVTIGTTGRVRVAPTVRGKANAFARGIQLLGTANDKISIDPTLIEAAAINGGAANKVVVDPLGTPVQLTAPGNYTSAGASGTAGQGIHLTGITV